MQASPKTVVIAPDSFKESRSAAQVASAIARGIHSVYPDVACIERPIADGGEGTVDTILSCIPGERVSLTVHDALMRPITAEYGLIDDGTTAVIEVAAASGLSLVSPDDRNALVTTSYGTGELIRDALDRGAQRCIIGLGGSATNDAGAGIASALGIRLLDEQHEDISPGGLELVRVAAIDRSEAHPGLAKTTIALACDVNIPMHGPQGSMLNYSAQKGATPDQEDALEKSLVHFGGLLNEHAGYAVSELPGAGAAGAMGAGLVALCGGSLKPGFELLSNLVGLEEVVAECDLVITGEGRIDAQTEHGKAPMGVAKIARRYGKPVVAFCGTVAYDMAFKTEFFKEVITIDSIASDHNDAIKRADHYLAELAESFARRWSAVLD
ncbi:MAG: glycerate kinase [Candidatus Hydrogenedentota bacterium]